MKHTAKTLIEKLESQIDRISRARQYRAILFGVEITGKELNSVKKYFSDKGVHLTTHRCGLGLYDILAEWKLPY